MSQSGAEFTTPEAFFNAHCSKPGGVILIEIVDTEGQTVERGIFTEYRTAKIWTEQFQHNDQIEKCAFIPQYLDYPEYGEDRTKLH